MPNLSNLVWLTGASSGIGHQLAIDLAAQGHRVIVSARRADRLEALSYQYPERIYILPLDVSDYDQVMAACDHINRHYGYLDTVILNAGTCDYIDVKHFSARAIENVMHTNFSSMLYCIEGTLPLLRKSKTPHLVGMSSTVAYLGLPRAQAYGTSKAAITYLFDSLRVDLTAEGIDVSVISPGFVQTPLTDKNDFPMPLRISVAAASRAICRGLMARSHHIHFPKAFSYTLKALSLLPSGLRNKLLQRTVRS